LFVFSALFSLALIVAMVWRREARTRVPEADLENWEMARPTSLTGKDIDPRMDTE
jgi:hypothetical protein